MKKKLMYEVPDVELIELKLDSIVMQSYIPGDAGSDEIVDVDEEMN